MAFIDKNEWSKFTNIINEFHNDAFQDTLTWYRYKEVIPRHGADEAAYAMPQNLNCLFHYNYFRTWPLTDYTITGEIDKQSELAIMNVEYLRSLNLLDDKLKLIYNPDKDIFIHRNTTYVASGDTFIAQADGTPLLFIIVLKREANLPYELPAFPTP